ncbi:MAG: hypothetical protein JXR60_10305 [Bacteroidales bacterium]|nr:hypothetical protein [Bacteroidales bacterium]
MKTFGYKLLAIILSLGFVLSSCVKEDDPTNNDQSILPSQFSIDVPNSISSQLANKSTQSDTLNGNEIYGHLRNFIAIGEGAATIVESIIGVISVYQINHAMNLTYTSDEDQREKNLVVLEEQSYEGQQFEFSMTISDAQSTTNADEGKGLQIFWNRQPIEGVAILKPYNINRDENLNQMNAIFKIEYSEVATSNYEKHMVVSIANLNNLNADPYYMKNLKMFVGKNSDIIDVYGNSDHPNANFFTNETGFDWAFVASSVESSDIGVAEVGLPSNDLNTYSRSAILVDNALQTVFSTQIGTLGYAQEDIDRFLYNTEAPGFFNRYGFVQGGTAPSSDYDAITSRISLLTPYNPYEIANLSVVFE